jgi:hypothetical protein
VFAPTKCYPPLMVTRYAGIFCGSCGQFNSLKKFETDSPQNGPSFQFTVPEDYTCMHCFQSIQYKPQAVTHCGTPEGKDPVCFQLSKEVKGRSFGADDVVLIDDTAFRDCSFDNGCTIVYRGGTVVWQGCRFNTYKLKLEDAAERTLAVLKELGLVLATPSNPVQPKKPI